MDEVKYGGGLTAEQRLARLEQRLGVGILAPTVEGSVLTGALTQPGLVTWKPQTARFKVGRFNPPAAPGTKVVTGVGFKPGLVTFSIVYASGTHMFFGQGAMDASGGQWSTAFGSVSGVEYEASSAGACIYTISAAGVLLNLAGFASMDADGFTVNFTNAGDPNFIVNWIAHA